MVRYKVFTDSKIQTVVQMVTNVYKEAAVHPKCRCSSTNYTATEDGILIRSNLHRNYYMIILYHYTTSCIGFFSPSSLGWVTFLLMTGSYFHLTYKSINTISSYCYCSRFIWLKLKKTVTLADRRQHTEWNGIPYLNHYTIRKTRIFQNLLSSYGGVP